MLQSGLAAALRGIPRLRQPFTTFRHAASLHQHLTTTSRMPSPFTRKVTTSHGLAARLSPSNRRRDAMPHSRLPPSAADQEEGQAALLLSNLPPPPPTHNLHPSPAHSSS
ncbi:uncharacterized protein UDID_18449 [Ustilago sp. UG-2017a]|nr:uncharacterized protein UDID_18449 [Ustilago sp. UG-2017a]